MAKAGQESGPKPPKSDLRHEPTKAELEEDMRIDATPHVFAQAMFGPHSRRVVH